MKLPPPLALDPLVRPSPLTAAGALLAVLAIGAVLGLANWQSRLADERARLEAAAELAGGPRRALPAVAIDPRKAGDAARRASLVAAQLALPWGGLFDAVEGAADGNVALLGLEPDPNRGLLRLTAEARDKEAMLGYLERLQQQPSIARAALESHTAREGGDARAPVQFVLVAHWNVP